MAFGKSDNNEFFNSWELWQKMTFVSPLTPHLHHFLLTLLSQVLACGIVRLPLILSTLRLS
jgi:hypothetical protein